LFSGRASEYPDVKACILLVDDDASVRRSLTRLLRAHDYEVLEAEDATKALQILATVRPAVVVMDMVMSGEDPLGAARKIKGEPRTAAVPIIALTASPPNGPSDSALFAGVLPKPSDASILLATIERAVAGPHSNI
jgi:two-component system cell cycle response regulator DivK